MEESEIRTARSRSLVERIVELERIVEKLSESIEKHHCEIISLKQIIGCEINK